VKTKSRPVLLTIAGTKWQNVYHVKRSSRIPEPENINSRYAAVVNFGAVHYEAAPIAHHEFRSKAGMR